MTNIQLEWIPEEVEEYDWGPTSLTIKIEIESLLILWPGEFDMEIKRIPERLRRYLENPELKRLVHMRFAEAKLARESLRKQLQTKSEPQRREKRNP